MCFFKLIKVHLLVSELSIYQNARCNDRKKEQILVVVYIKRYVFGQQTGRQQIKDGRVSWHSKYLIRC